MVDWGVVAGTEGGVVAEVLGAEISSIEGWIAKVLFRVRAAEEGMAVWRLRAAGGGQAALVLGGMRWGGLEGSSLNGRGGIQNGLGGGQRWWLS